MLKKLNASTVEASFGAGVITNLITNPLSVVRARMLLTSKGSNGGNYASLANSLAHIAKNEGIRGFYKVNTVK